jgi:hypothetical protein
MKVAVTKETANKACCLELAYGQANQAVARMTKMGMVKPKVTSKEGGLFQPVEKSNNFLVLHSGAPSFKSDLARADTPAPQKLPLILRDILIEKGHQGIATSSSLWLISTSRANRTDSPMASWLTAPRQASVMASQAMPFAT